MSFETEGVASNNVFIYLTSAFIYADIRTIEELSYVIREVPLVLCTRITATFTNISKTTKFFEFGFVRCKALFIRPQIKYYLCKSARAQNRIQSIYILIYYIQHA